MASIRRLRGPGAAALLALAALAGAVPARSGAAPTEPPRPAFKALTWAEFLSRPQPQPQARISYGPGAQQIGELWLPDGAGPHPLVVLIHGGCWTKSVAKLSIMNAAAEDLRKRGAAVWNIEYRGVDEPGGGYPGTYQDVADALDRVGGFADEAHLDLNRVVVVGHSAGGHLALWAAARRRITSGPLASRRGPPIAAVVDVAGLPDLAEDSSTACGAEPVEKMAGPARLGGRYRDTSPAHMLPLHVRQLVVVGREDVTVPPAVSEAYVRLARNAGDRVDYRVLPDAGHAEEIAPGTPGWDRIAPLIMELAR